MIVSGSSGLDIDALVGGLVAAARAPITQLASRKAQLDGASKTVGGITTKLSALKTAVSALSTRAGFASSTVVASSGALVGRAVGTTVPGSYTVSVSQVATAQRSRSDLQPSSTDALGVSGTLGLVVGASPAVDVTVDAGDSLSTLATKINQSGARLRASVLDTGAGFRLVVAGMDSGAASSFVLDQQGFDLGLQNVANEVQPARDANLVIDGTAITRPTNQISDAIPGVTLSISETIPSAVVRVEADASALESKIGAFVAAYNDLVSDSHAATGFGSTVATNRTLAGDRVVRAAVGDVRRAAGDPISGATGAVRSLADAGLRFDNDGKLTLDKGKLAAALASDPAAVERLFVSDVSFGTTSAMDRIVAAIDTHATGPQSRLSSHGALLAARASRLDGERSKMEARLVTYEAQLRKQFLAMEQIVTKYQLAGSSLPSGNTGFQG